MTNTPSRPRVSVIAGDSVHSPLRRAVLALGLSATIAPSKVLAQAYPSKPIRLVVGFPPGGSADFGARVIAPALGKALGGTVIVDNKPGATGSIAAVQVAKSPADGYQLLIATPTAIVIAPQAMPKPPFNPLTDFVGVNMISTAPMAFAINPKLGVRTLKELIALSRKREVTLGSPGAGGTPHLLIETLAQTTGGKFTHVPYKGTGPSVTDAVAGHIDGAVADLQPFYAFHQSGKLLVIAVTSEKRSDMLPNVPTAAEDVPGLVVTNWMGVFAASKTPPELIAKINAALQKVVAREDVRSQFATVGVVPTSMATPEAFQKFVAAEYDRWGKLLREKNIVITE